jgi:ATP-dependent RNA helicase DeaD
MISFEMAGLNSDLQKAAEKLGFKNPTPVQEKTIPHLLNSTKDLIALAQTGTGKTAAFGFPIIQQLDENLTKPQAIIVSPTRELCLQIAGDLERYSRFTKNVKIVPVYGGVSIDTQIKALKAGAQVVVATPGRALDLIKRKRLNISEIKWLVLDEADEMLNMGFKEDLDAILANTPESKQTLLFSATMPREIRRIANTYMHDPEEFTIGAKNKGAENVEHIYYRVHARDKYLALKRIADVNPDIYGIVFCRTRKETKEISEKLIQDGYDADALHGDLSQQQRDQVMNRFRRRNLQILVATDVAARGLDVNDLTHVINYHLPDELEAYIHRSGRTGRAGKSGISISIIHGKELGRIKALERMTGKKFEHKLIPNGREICEKQLFNLVDKVEKIEVNHEQIDEYLPIIYKKLSWLSREDLIKHFVSVEFNRFLAYYENAPDLNLRSREKEYGGGREKRGGDKRYGGGRKFRERDMRFARFHINLGSADDFSPPELINLINRQRNTRGVEIGKIEIMKKFSFFDADKEFADELVKTFSGVNFKGKDVVIEKAAEKPRSGPPRDRSNKGKRKKKKYA